MGCQEFNDISIFKDNMTTFKETSHDKDSNIPRYMTNSEIQVINFDRVKECYIKNMSLSSTPCSNDALYIGKDNKIFFVEFKNGALGKNKKMIFNVYNKIYDSLLIFNDIVHQNISFCRENVYFILVYNESKNNEECGTKQEDSPKALISKFIHNKAKKKYVRFGVDKFEKIYFKEVFTYTETEFETFFISPINQNSIPV